MSDDLQIKIAQPDDFEKIGEVFDCLLYTSDAADD